MARTGQRGHDPAAAFTIVRLDSADWSAHRALRLEMLLDSPEAFWGTYADALQLTPDDWRAQLSDDRIVLHASSAETDEPLGCLVLLLTGYTEDMPLAADEAILTKIWVRPAARGRGVSAALVREAAHLAEGMGRPRLLLDVDDSNTAAIRSYERMGFRPTGSSYPREGTGTCWTEYSAHAAQLR
ncbi:GNAT family N-acetyltransferase [Brevibacterium otitidis]|uniref:GNAT family N-acetyltransferase n=1 Tax=Brevibacterium otitidis TaxID=53364 RepID=A0ABV5WZS4_9MICO|nr:GNAT family N-acetyltransferase [Brevibacterium otitidis]